MLLALTASTQGKNLFVDGIPGRGTVQVTEAEIAAGLFLDKERILRVVARIDGRSTVIEVVDADGDTLARAQSRGRRATLSFRLPKATALGDAEKDLLRQHGRVYRDGDATVVEVMGKAWLLNEPGVTCANPTAPEPDRVYRKVFAKKKIYLPDEYDRAVAECLSGRDVFVLGMNGYSAIKPEKCREYGIDPGAYEIACEELLEFAIRSLRTAFPDISVRVIHGSSAMGVDLAIQRCARRVLRDSELGFSCPEYLFYVQDDSYPVYVASSVHDYSQSFVRSCNVLIAANGRLQAFRMDIAAVFEHDKYLIPVNVIKLISRTGSPAAKNALGQIEDAVAHYEQRVFQVGKQVTEGTAADRWKATGSEVRDVLVNIARHVLPKEISWKLGA